MKGREAGQEFPVPPAGPGIQPLTDATWQLGFFLQLRPSLFRELLWTQPSNTTPKEAESVWVWVMGRGRTDAEANHFKSRRGNCAVFDTVTLLNLKGS